MDLHGVREQSDSPLCGCAGLKDAVDDELVYGVGLQFCWGERQELCTVTANWMVGIKDLWIDHRLLWDRCIQRSMIGLFEHFAFVF